MTDLSTLLSRVERGSGQPVRDAYKFARALLAALIRAEMERQP